MWDEQSVVDSKRNGSTTVEDALVLLRLLDAVSVQKLPELHACLIQSTAHDANVVSILG